MKMLIKNGLLVDPMNNINRKMDILLDSGKVVKVARSIKPGSARTIDAKGKIVTPGLIDMHVHLREPGREDKETIATASRAAARGGFTTIVGMPNTTPVADDQTVIRYVVEKAKAEAAVNVLPVGCITKGREGKELAQVTDLKKEGAVAVSDDGSPVMDADLMMKAMRYCRMCGLLIISHSEDLDLAGKGVMHEGLVSTRLGLKGKPAAAEEVMISREILLSEATGCPIHFCHVSSKTSAKLIRAAKARGVNVTCDTCPHYFTLTDEEVLGYNQNAKVNPPLRSRDHVKEIKNALKNSTIDCITSDHAPHTLVEKYVEFDLAENGIIGLETTLPLVMTYAVEKNVLKLKDAVAKMTCNPARILGLESKGHLGIGADADVTVIDPKRKEKIDPNLFESKARNTPFAGWDVTGVPVMTIVGGKVVMEDRKIVV